MPSQVINTDVVFNASVGFQLAPDSSYPFLRSFDPATGVERGRTDLGSSGCLSLSEPLLTAKGAVLFGSSLWNPYSMPMEARQLEAVAPDLSTVFSCPVSASSSSEPREFGRGAVLLRERWVVETRDVCSVWFGITRTGISAWDLPGFTAGQGWASARGGPRRNGRPR